MAVIPLHSPSLGLFVTDHDLSPVLQIITWILLAVTTLMLVFRLLTRFVLKGHRKVGWEEGFIVAAFVFGVAQCGTVLVPEARGLLQDGNDNGVVVVALKLQFAGELLFVLSACFAKLAVCASFLSFSPHDEHRLASYVIAGFVVLWAVSSVFGLGFQCGGRGSWGGADGCVNQLRLYQYVAVGNIVSDALLVALPVWVIFPLNLAHGTRGRIISFYCARVLVIIATIISLIYLPHRFSRTNLHELLAYLLAVQLALSGSIVTACVTYFWPFLKSLRSGLFWQTNTRFSTQHTLTKLASLRTVRGMDGGSEGKGSSVGGQEGIGKEDGVSKGTNQ